jgi:hypothetical protein
MHTGKQSFQCIYCDKLYEIFNSLYSHIVRFHCIKPIVCKFIGCTQLFQNNDDLSEHMKTKHKKYKDRAYECIYCGKICKGSGYLYAHVESYHKGRSHKCKHCPQYFETNNQKIEHMIADHKTKNFLCVVCGRAFATTAQRHFHMKRKHQNEAIRCTFLKYCSEWFKTNEDLQRHIQEDHQNLKFKCLFCDKGNFTIPASLNKHTRIYHMDVALWCEYTKVCGTHFKTEEARQKHYKEKHEGQKNMRTCIFCNKKVARKGGCISYHLKMHHPGERFFKCSYLPCIEYFKTEVDKQNHVQQVHEKIEGSLKCIFCEKFIPCPKSLRGTRRSRLAAHIRELHSDVAIKCNYYDRCPYYFKSEEDRDKHIKDVHQNKKTYKCNNCKKVFRTENGVKIHNSRVHHIEKELLQSEKYKCPKCPADFALHRDFQLHKLTEHGIQSSTSKRNYHIRRKCPHCNILKASAAHISQTPCDICGEAFKCRGLMGKHKLNVHPRSQCRKCGKTFSTPWYCSEHRKICQAYSNVS